MPVAIIGMHRSGTSLVAGTLRLCGLSMGSEADMVPAHESNQKGHWEHKGFVDLDERLLACLETTWSDPGALSPGWLERPDVQELVAEARDFVARTFGQADEPTWRQWGWKDPRTTMLIPFWRQVVPDLRFVLCVRNPLDVAHSLNTRDLMPTRIGLALWQCYIELALRDTRDTECAIMHYEDALEDHRSALKPVLEFLGLPQLVAGSERDRAVADFAETSLQHHRHTLRDILESPHTSTPLRLLYRELVREPAAVRTIFERPAAELDPLPSTVVLDREFRRQVQAQTQEVERHTRHVEAEYERMRKHADHAEAEYRRVTAHARQVDERNRHLEDSMRAAAQRAAHQPKLPRLYVCHAHADDAFCQPFVAHLRTHYHAETLDQIFVDESSYHDANAPHLMELWQARNDAEIRSRPLFVALVSAALAADEGLREEIALAHRLAEDKSGRAVILLQVGPCDPLTLAELLGNAVVIDGVHQSYATAWGELQQILDDAARHGAIRIDENRIGDSGGADAGDGQRARAAASVRNWETARDVALRALEREPYRADLWRIVGQAEAARGDHGTAIAALDRARALLPLDESQARLELLEERHGQERLQKWADRFAPTDPATPINPFTPPEQRRDGLIAIARYADALKVARQLVEQRSAEVEHWLVYARLLLVTGGDPVVLAEALTRAHAVRPEDPGLAAACAGLETRQDLGTALARLCQRGYALQEHGDHQVLVPPRRFVAEGPCVIGSDPLREPEAYADEQPQHELTLLAYEIAQYPVTVGEYALFVATGHRPPDGWEWQLTAPDVPVTHVSWLDARAYAAWLAELTGAPWRLPTEAEWEKAARWDAASNIARRYPWGEAFSEARANTRESALGIVVPIGSYPHGASPCGAEDMAGNCWEWTASVASPYPLDTLAAQLRASALTDRALRGGSAREPATFARTACRGKRVPLALGATIGFRLALGAEQ